MILNLSSWVFTVDSRLRTGMTVRDVRNNGDEMMKMIMVGAGRGVRWWMIDGVVA